MSNKAMPGIYSNKLESFQIQKTDNDEVLNITALTTISYFPLFKGTTIPLNKETIESLINDEELGFRLQKV